LIISPCDPYFISGYYYVMLRAKNSGSSYYNLTVSYRSISCTTTYYDYLDYRYSLGYNSWLYFQFYTGSNVIYALLLDNYISNTKAVLYYSTSGDPTASQYNMISNPSDSQKVIYHNSSCSSTSYYAYMGVYCSTAVCDFKLYSYKVETDYYCPASISASYYASLPYTTNNYYYFFFSVYQSSPRSYDLQIYTLPSSTTIYADLTTTKPTRSSYDFSNAYGTLTISASQFTSSNYYTYIGVYSKASFTIYTSFSIVSTTSSGSPGYPSYCQNTLKQSAYESSSCKGDFTRQISISLASTSVPCFYSQGLGQYIYVYCSGSDASYKTCGTSSSCTTCSVSTNYLTSCTYDNLFSASRSSLSYYRYACTCGGTSLVVSSVLLGFLSVMLYLLIN